METNPDILAARAKLAAKLSKGGQVGGKGSVRRKKVIKHHDTQVDDKKFASAIKKYNWQHIPDIKEVNMFREDGSIIHYANPRFEASQSLSGYMVSGKAENKKLEELLPGILQQLDKNDLATLQSMAREFAAKQAQAKGSADDDDEFGDINFEEASKN